MQRSTWKVSDLLLLVLSAAMAFGAFRYFWRPPPPHPNMMLFLSAYLATLATASLGSFLGRPTLRRPCQGYAAFGWLNLVFVLRGGLGVVNIYDAEAIVEGVQMGMAFGAICALVAAWFLEPPRSADEPARKDPGSDRGHLG
jgi:hypothetical protein